MKYPTTLIVAVLLCSTATAAPQEVTCESPCSCSSAHGKGRWSVKNDPETPPTDTSTIQAVTPSDIFSWAGPDVHQQSKRTGLEQNWFSLTGRVVAVKVEADGDLHIELSDATGDKQGIVVVEIPLGPQWCNIRTTVFSWSPIRFPFQTRSTKKLKIIKPPIIKSFDRQLFRPGPAQCSAPLRGASLDL
ncbi:MAG TPA: hypothetical protein VM783_00350 [Candidatus Acidoferrum sp.]|nr:hypothetical protein [Candidatus Acidoferrum sp.]